jgi:putative endonuclease
VLWRNKNNNIGEVGEKAAKKFLKKKGFKIVELNYQNNKGRRLGEIDIIAKKDGEIVFVEVKTRKTDNSDVLPEENIDRKKLHKLQKIAQAYLKEKELMTASYHFDAVSVLISLNNEKVVKIKHLENIFI